MEPIGAHPGQDQTPSRYLSPEQSMLLMMTGAAKASVLEAASSLLRRVYGLMACDKSDLDHDCFVIPDLWLSRGFGRGESLAFRMSRSDG